MFNNTDISSNQLMEDGLKKDDIIVLTLMIVVMILGIVGNTFVWYIFFFKMDRTAANIFMTVLGTCDFLSSSICIPLDIIIYFHLHDIIKDISCRIIRFISMDVNITSALIVFTISVDRYRKVVIPLGQQITRHQVRYVCLLVVFSSTGLSLPCLFFVMTGMQCTLSYDSERHLIYLIALVVCCALLFICLCTIYSILGIRLCRYANERKIRLNSSESISRDSLSVVKEFYIREQQRLDTIKKGNSNKEEVDIEEGECTVELNILRRSSSRTQRQLISSPARTTLITFLISLAWLISFAPHLTVVTLLATEGHHSVRITDDIIYSICIRSFYFHNVANPWIYAVFNKRYRREFFALVRRPFW